MFGWTGRTIIVNIWDNSVTELRTKKAYAQEFIGGRGLGCRLMEEFTEPVIEPLSPENPLIFTTGPLTGTSAPMSGHFSVTCKSPLTSTIFSSNAGGYFGAELKFAGIDALVITGKAERPVYLNISDEDVEILPAGHLWGKSTAETTALLETKGKVACIGKAGEKLVSMANIINDRIYSSGRGGHGAVAGSKNLKAIVVKGTNIVEVAEPDAFGKAAEKTNKLLVANPSVSKGLAKYGSSVFTDLLDYIGVLPARNFMERKFSGADNLSGENISRKYKVQQAPCYGCPIGCRRTAEDGRPVPDFDSIWAFGPNIGNNDLELIREMDKLCFDYGLDPLSCGASIAAYMEANPWMEMDEVKGIILEIGNGKHDVCKGSHAYLCSVEKDEYSTAVKGLELPGYDPREMAGMAIAYATSNTGGSHLSAFMAAPELMGKPVLLDRKSFNGKAALVQYFQNLTAAIDSLVMCPYSILAIGEVELAALLSHATGRKYSAEEMLVAGERIYNLERLFNIKSGFTSKDDTLPDKFFGEEGINRNEFEKAISDYYHFRGWDADGIPAGGKLRELNITKAQR
ncbi:aldehyde ferredoxin oxidoreductase family protein [Methanolobus psychrotolerans]|uniref:aldehyde ferredoxin oxidoreductase family protein n=1 Tax=Methanolobus psychrotolerans TaxID=1874706 RepID=UPI000B915837|nr:aldehyde ferredoxin oxidoreductase family protein [Methanolobus psychrotolerans]